MSDRSERANILTLEPYRNVSREMNKSRDSGLFQGRGIHGVKCDLILPPTLTVGSLFYPLILNAKSNYRASRGHLGYPFGQGKCDQFFENLL